MEHTGLFSTDDYTIIILAHDCSYWYKVNLVFSSGAIYEEPIILPPPPFFEL